MPAKVIAAHEKDGRFIVEIHLDDQRVDGEQAPDPDWVFSAAYELEQPLVVILAQALTQAKAKYDLRRREYSLPIPHPLEGARLDLDRLDLSNPESTGDQWARQQTAGPDRAGNRTARSDPEGPSDRSDRSDCSETT